MDGDGGEVGAVSFDSFLPFFLLLFRFSSTLTHASLTPSLFVLDPTATPSNRPSSPPSRSFGTFFASTSAFDFLDFVPVRSRSSWLVFLTYLPYLSLSTDLLLSLHVFTLRSSFLVCPSPFAFLGLWSLFLLAPVSLSLLRSLFDSFYLTLHVSLSLSRSMLSLSLSSSRRSSTRVLTGKRAWRSTEVPTFKASGRSFSRVGIERMHRR